MGDLASLTAHVRAGRDLSGAEADSAAAALAAEGTSDGDKADFLSALAGKGETVSEIVSFARAFRALAADPGLSDWSDRAVDVVGTGGDHSGGFNISSVVTLVVACAGVPVMKHGNRAVTSRSGSADMFAGFGVDLEAPPARLRAALGSLGYVFLFAPAWHPAFKRVGPARRLLAARGERSVFNILGPLVNPGRPAHVLLGAASPELAERLARALDALGTRAGLAVHGVISPGRGIDELTTATLNVVRGAGRLRSLGEEWTPESLGLQRSPFSDMAGGDIAQNLAAVAELAGGGGPRGLADTIALNSAAALWLAVARPDVRGSIGEAREILLGGAVRRKIADTRDFYAGAGRDA
jgi:anthranilate phosphoribosyltransferase